MRFRAKLGWVLFSVSACGAGRPEASPAVVSVPSAAGQPAPRPEPAPPPDTARRVLGDPPSFDVPRDVSQAAQGQINELLQMAMWLHDQLEKAEGTLLRCADPKQTCDPEALAASLLTVHDRLDSSYFSCSLDAAGDARAFAALARAHQRYLFRWLGLLHERARDELPPDRLQTFERGLGQRLAVEPQPPECAP